MESIGPLARSREGQVAFAALAGIVAVAFGVVVQTRALTVEKKRGAPKTGEPVANTPEDTPEGLDWQAFSAAYFPGRRRHDFEALVAYGAYRRARIVDELSSEDADRNDGAKSNAVGAPALQAWEDEGGALP